MDPQGKSVVITGASSGIGAAAARAFVAAGANVVLAARNDEALQALAQELGPERALAVQTDVTRREHVEGLVERAVERFGRVDVFVNNAGVGLLGSVADVDPDAFEQAFRINVMGALYGMQAAVRAMRRTGGGMIVNVSSGTTRMLNPALGGGYPAMKRMLEILSDYARLQLEDENIRFLVVLPYITESNFMANLLGNRGAHLGHREHLRRNLPPAHPAEKVADAIVSGVRNEETEVSLVPHMGAS